MEARLALGRQIAEARRRHGLSQPELARKLDRPVQWMSQVERGLADVDPAAILAAVASVLGGPPIVLSASSSRPRSGGTDPAAALRFVLSGGAQPRSRRTGPPPTTTALGLKADRAWDLTCTKRYGDLAELLSDLMPELEAALHAAHDQRQRQMVLEVMATSYQACSAALAKLGDHEGAKSAASRALIAAQRAGDLLLAAASAYLLVCILMEAGRYSHAEETARKAAAALAQLAAEGRREAISLRGALALRRALVAARIGDPAAAEEQLGLARDMARQLGDADGPSDAGFGHDQIAQYAAAVGAETGRRSRTAGSPSPAGRRQQATIGSHAP